MNYPKGLRTLFFAVFILSTLCVQNTFSQSGTNSWKSVKSLAKFKNDTRPKVKVRVQENSKQRITLDYAFPDIKLSKLGKSLGNKELVTVALGNAKITGKEGEPILPVIPTQVLLPEGYSIERVFVNTGNKSVLKGAYSVQHHEGFFKISSPESGQRVERKAAIYNSDSEFPKRRCQLVGVQKKHGASIATINLYPVIYKPKSGNLVHFNSMKLHVVLKKDAAQFRASGITPKLHRLNQAALAVENPETIETYSEGTATRASVLNASDNFQYVFITNAETKDATTDVTVHDLIAHRENSGITATIKTTEEIFTEYDGVDDAEKVRNFIIDAYNNWNTQYVVLGGDINIVPMRKLYVDGDHLPSDLYYQCLDGSMNNDNDNNWGESNDGIDGGDIDLVPEIAIGRISGENPEEISNHIYKILAYENEEENASYLRKTLISGEHLGSNFGPDVFGYGRSYMSHIIEGTSAGGYTTAGFNACPLITVDTIYDWTATWAKSDIIDLINSNEYSVINHLGHANYNYVMKFYNNDADVLTNEKYLFLNSQGCIPGNFEADCIAEHLTTSTRNGLYACILNSNNGWGAYNDSYETLDGPSQRFQREFWDAYFDENIMRLGELNADSHEDNIWDINGTHIRWCYYETNLFGDPCTIMKGKSTEAFLTYNTVSVDDQIGNDNGTINPGEEISLMLNLSNLGIEDAAGVTATISTDNNKVTVIDPHALFETISGGTNKTALDDMRINIAPSCPTPATITFTVTITDDASKSWESEFDLQVFTTSNVSGFVSSFTGENSVEGATVHYSGPESGTITTDIEGFYTFDAIDGEYTLYVTSDDFVPSDTTVISIPPDTSDVNFYLKRPQISISTNEITDTLETGQSSAFELLVKNSGDTDLLFDINLTDFSAFAFSCSPYVYAAEYQEDLKKGEVDNRLGQPVAFNKGGPDEFGYTWIDSDENGGPQYIWQDITETGTLLADVSGQDDRNEKVALGFTFPFYGNDFDSMYVVSNGYVTFGTGATDYTNSPIPGTGNPANLVAPFFDDLRSRNIYLLRESNRVIVQYEEATPYSGSGTYTFQIVLESNGTIRYYYKDMNGSVTNATVGIQNATQDDGLSVAYNTPYITDSLAVTIKQGPQWLIVEPLSGSVPAGGEVSVSVTLDATDLVDSTYLQNINVTHNDPTKDSAEVALVTLVVDNPAQPPVVTTEPVNSTIYEGDTAQFLITAAGSDLIYQWQKDGADIVDANDASLMYPSVVIADDQAQFRCIVTNDLGADTSATAVLTVLPRFSVEYDSTLTSSFDTISHSDSVVDPTSLDTTVTTIDSITQTDRLIVRTDSLDHGVVFDSTFDTTVTVFPPVIDTSVIVLPYNPVITVEYDTTVTVTLDTLSSVDSLVDPTSLDTTVITTDSLQSSTETILQTDSLNNGVVFFTGYDTTYSVVMTLLSVDTIVLPYIPLITVEYDTTQTVTVDTVSEVDSLVDPTSLDTTVITIDSAVTTTETIIQTDSLDHGVIFFTGYDTTVTVAHSLISIDTIVLPYIPVITVEYDTTVNESYDTIQVVDSVVDATTLDTAVTTIDSLITSLETIIRTDSLDHGVIFYTGYDTTYSEIREELSRNTITLPYIPDEYLPWDPNQLWFEYNEGDLRSNGGKVWRCTNKAFAYLEPSSAWGHYGWAYVKDL